MEIVAHAAVPKGEKRGGSLAQSPDVALLAARLSAQLDALLRLPRGDEGLGGPVVVPLDGSDVEREGLPAAAAVPRGDLLGPRLTPVVNLEPFPVFFFVFFRFFLLLLSRLVAGRVPVLLLRLRSPSPFPRRPRLSPPRPPPTARSCSTAC